MYVNKNGTELWQPLSLGKTLNFHENEIVMCSMGILSTETSNSFSFLKSSQNQVAVSSVRHSTVSLHLPFDCLYSFNAVILSHHCNLVYLCTLRLIEIALRVATQPWSGAHVFLFSRLLVFLRFSCPATEHLIFESL